MKPALKKQRALDRLFIKAIKSSRTAQPVDVGKLNDTNEFSHTDTPNSDQSNSTSAHTRETLVSQDDDQSN
jgi:hypothetical protein